MWISSAETKAEWGSSIDSGEIIESEAFQFGGFLANVILTLKVEKPNYVKKYKSKSS